MNRIRSTLRNGKDHLVNHGIRHTLNIIYQYHIRSYFWDIKSTFKLSTNGFEARFHADNRNVVDRERWRFEQEESLIRDLLSEMESDDVFYDIGAHIGLYSSFASHICEDGQVIAFEPYEPNIRQFEKNSGYNCEDRIKLFEIALSDENGVAELAVPDDSSMGYGSGGLHNDGEYSITVNTTVGDQFIANMGLPVPSIVKIDVEGAEALVINGMEEMLRDENCRLVYVEIHPKKFIEPGSDSSSTDAIDYITNRLENMGFAISQLDNRDSQIHLKARKGL